MTTVLSQKEIQDLINQTYKDAEGTRDLLFRQKSTIIQALEYLQAKIRRDDERSELSNIAKNLAKKVASLDVEISDFHRESSEGMKINEELERELVH